MKILGKTILVIVIILFIILMLGLPTDKNDNLKTVWGINIPKANKVEIIYNYKYPDGEDLEIWNYEEEKVKEIINNNKFKNIDEQDKSFIQEHMEDYYRILDDNEKNLFNKNVDISSLLVKENYFAFTTQKEDERSWLLLILDTKNCKLYYVSNVY